MASASRRGARELRGSGLYLGNVNGKGKLGQASDGGVPRPLKISLSSSSTVEPGKRGRPQAISKNIHPTPLK